MSIYLAKVERILDVTDLHSQCQISDSVQQHSGAMMRFDRYLKGQVHYKNLNLPQLGKGSGVASLARTGERMKR